VLAAGLCGIAAVTTLLGRLTSGPETQTKPVVLSDIEGSAAYPAFSADGNRLAYCDRPLAKGAAYHLFVRRAPTGAVTPLTTGESNDISPAWSPDGSRIAFLRMQEGKAQLLVIPSEGGTETRIAEFPAADNGQSMPALAWSHDGKSLATVVGGENQPAAIALISVANGALRRITTPPAGTDGDWAPAFSPDGSRLAFIRGSSPGSGSEDVYVAASDGGNPQRLTFDERIARGVTWSSSGSELIYAAARAGRLRLWRIPSAGGSPHEVIGTDFMARYPSVAKNRLAYTAGFSVTTIWRGDLTEPLAPAHRSARDGEEQTPTNARPLLRSNGPERLASYSPDGTRIADISEQAGSEEIWISDADGGNRFQVTNHTEAQHPQLGRPIWSPDGKWLLYDQDGGQHGEEIWKVEPKKGAKPVRVSTEGHSGAWSHDGKSIYYADRGQLWKLPLSGGKAQEIVQRNGGGAPVESLDGKYIYYRFRGASIWRVPVAGGDAEPFVDADGPIFGDPEVVKGGIYYLVLNRFDRSVLLCFYDAASKRTKDLYRLPLNNFSYTPVFSVSPDGKNVIFARVDQSQTNLMFVENFK
jgi:Tol biopolymer transport system component